MCHGQLEFIPGMQGLFNIQKHQVIYFNILTGKRRKNDIIISIHVGKAFEKIQRNKNSQKNKNRGNFNLVEHLEKLPLKLIVKAERFPLKIGKKQRMSPVTNPIQDNNGYSSQCNKARK